uniref:Uncharacterized protein n=1 Tax=Romanomermis culicivorax TaxID=13658 RepID=A0A915L862_ROMCU
MDARNAYLILEPHIRLKDMRQFAKPIWVNLAGKKKPNTVDLDIIGKVLTMAQNLLDATSDELEQQK